MNFDNDIICHFDIIKDCLKIHRYNFFCINGLFSIELIILKHIGYQRTWKNLFNFHKGIYWNKVKI